MAAREHLYPGSGRTGIPVLVQRIRVFFPEVIEHYSIRSAMAWMSLGEENVVRVPVDKDFCICASTNWKDGIDEERAKGNHILACVAYAGDSRSMCVDNLEGIADCLSCKNVWFHVDACHGSQLAFSKKHRHKIQGIERAASVTIDPHKVLWIPNTCSFVLFRDPKSLANISTNSDLILKTQWSLGQITPCIGSKAFDSLKLWSVIRYFGQSGIEKLIDARLALTEEIQAEIGRRPDLVLLNKTDINSCVFLFVPNECQKGGELSAADVEKINAVNLQIKSQITEGGEFYLHFFTLKRCPRWLLPDRHAVYVLRMMNGNPRSTMANVNALLDRVVDLGRSFVQEKGYKILTTRPTVGKLSVSYRLKSRLEALFDKKDYDAVVYGSTTCEGNSLLSDIDLMVFAVDDVCTEENKKAVIELFKETMTEEGVRLDAEVPYERKMLIPMSFAKKVVEGELNIVANGAIPSIVKSEEYLNSDDMLSRLVLNVLTVPNHHLSGSGTLVTSLYDKAEKTLVSVVESANDGIVLDAHDFVRKAQSDGVRRGEEFLGYKDRPETIAHLLAIFDRQRPSININMSAQVQEESLKEPNTYPCVLFLNGFPGVGKLTVAREISKQLTTCRLLDNHLLIDAAQAIEPNRSPAHYTLRKNLRRAAFDGLKAVADKSATLILTSCSAATLPQDLDIFGEFVDIARARDVPFVSVNISCDEQANAMRVTSEERGVEKDKLTDVQVLKEMRRIHKLLDPSECIEQTAGVDVRHLEIDTTHDSVQQAANKVMEHLKTWSQA